MEYKTKKSIAYLTEIFKETNIINNTLCKWTWGCQCLSVVMDHIKVFAQRQIKNGVYTKFIQLINFKHIVKLMSHVDFSVHNKQLS